MLLLCILPFFSPVPFSLFFSFPSCLSVWTLTYCTCTIITEVPWIWNMLVMYAAPVAEQSWPRAEPPDSQSSASGARYTPGVLHAGSTTLPPAPSVQPPARSPFGLAPSKAAPVLGLRVPLLGFDTTVTIPRHTQLYGNTFHIHFILTVAVLQSAAACSCAHHQQTTIAAGRNSDFKPAKHDCRCHSGASTSSTADQAPPQIRICCISPLHE